MESLFCDVENIETYIDNIGCFDASWKQHPATIDTVLIILQNNNLTVNPLKCEWGYKETD